MGIQPVEPSSSSAERVHSANCTVQKLIAEVLRENLTRENRFVSGMIWRKRPPLN